MCAFMNSCATLTATSNHLSVSMKPCKHPWPLCTALPVEHRVKSACFQCTGMWSQVLSCSSCFVVKTKAGKQSIPSQVVG